MSHQYTTSNLREHLSEILGRVEFSKRRVVITRHGAAIAALIPISDFRQFEVLELDRGGSQPGERARGGLRLSPKLEWLTENIPPGHVYGSRDDD